MKDATAPQQTEMGTTLGPPKGTSGSEMVNPHRRWDDHGGCQTQGQLDSNVGDMVNSDSVAPLGRPPGLGFLGTGAQQSRDMGPVPRIRQLVELGGPEA